jgi:two-component system, NarL family, invasion response regulator UvrY
MKQANTKQQEPIKVLVVDDDSVYRDGVISVLKGVKDIRVVGEAADGREAIVQTKKLNPDVVTLDVVMPNGDGIEAERTLNRLFPKIKVLILTGFAGGYFPHYFQRMQVEGYGAKGEIDGAELATAIRTIYLKKVYLSENIAQTIAMESITQKEPSVFHRLSSTELSILMRCIRGESNDQIGGHFHVESKTISSHRTNIFRKLAIKSDVQLFLRAREEGLVPALGF